MPKEKKYVAPSEEASPLAAQTEPTPPGEPIGDDEETAGLIADGAAPASPALPPLTAERATDIFLGAMSIFAEATAKKAQELSEQAKTLREEGPAILTTYEERGRPLREQIIGKLRDGFAPIPDEGEGETSRTAAQDIQALEQRVRELEAEVAPESAPNEAADAAASETEFIAPETPSDETPAEVATFEAEGIPAFALADSPYAVSETPEEVEQETPETDEHENVKAETDNPGYGAE